MSESRVMRITAGDVSSDVTLAANATAEAIWNALPLEARANRWGDELYFSIPLDLEEDHAQEVVQVGDVAYWPPGTAVCIFWGPTPASTADEPHAASPVNVFGHIDNAAAATFAAVRSGRPIKLERA